jgi:hypothetical protein
VKGRLDHEQPQTELEIAADAALDAFCGLAERMGQPVDRAVFFVTTEGGTALSAGVGMADGADMLLFLLAYTKQFAEAIGVDVNVILPDEN